MSTIAAISTPRGVGGIAVIRLSGADALPIASRHLSLPKPKAGRPAVAFARFMKEDQLLDEVVVTVFPSPHSYTGDDTVEISCHGSLYVQQTLLQTLLDSGARLAEPGEFTRRAFLNGKLDLSQTEAVADLIESTNQTSHALAISQLRGGYAKELALLRQQLLELTSLLELELDFSQEDVEFADRQQLSLLVDKISLSVNRLIQSFQMGNVLKHGVPIAIIGRPNVGKSSLLNALLHDDRAIVSPIAGTTRDTIEETFFIDGIPFRIIDTAGLRKSDDPLEAMGVQRSVNSAVQADIIIFVHDATQPFLQTVADLDALQDFVSLKDKHLFVVHNKIDLHEGPLPDYCSFPISAKDGTGLDALLAKLSSCAPQYSAPDVLLTNVRHLKALEHTDKALAQVAKGLANGLSADLIAIDLRDALYHLGTITGEVTSDEVLGTIFSRFCVGK